MQQSGITDIFSVDLEQEAKQLLDLEDTSSLMEAYNKFEVKRDFDRL